MENEVKDITVIAQAIINRLEGEEVLVRGKKEGVVLLYNAIQEAIRGQDTESRGETKASQPEATPGK